MFFCCERQPIDIQGTNKTCDLTWWISWICSCFKGNSNHWAMRNPRRNLTYYSGSLVHTNQVPFFAEVLLSWKLSGDEKGWKKRVFFNITMFIPCSMITKYFFKHDMILVYLPLFITWHYHNFATLNFTLLLFLWSVIILVKNGSCLSKPTGIQNKKAGFFHVSPCFTSPIQSLTLPETNSFIVATKIGGKRKIKSVPFCRIRHDHSVEARPPIP